MNKAVSLLALMGLAGAASAAITIGPVATPFVDISGTGTSLGAPGDDPEYTLTAAALAGAGFAGNALLAAGVDVCVGNNGAVIWNATSSTNQVGYTNTNILTMAGANGTNTGNGGLNSRQFIAPHWDDLFGTTTAPASSVRWQVIGGNLYIQWSEEDHFSAQGTGRITFQMVVYSGYGAGQALVDFVYQDTDYRAPGGANVAQSDGGSASIGYKNWGVAGFANDLQWSQDTASVAGYAAAQNSAAGPNALRIIPSPGALALLGLGGLMAGRRRR